MRVHETNLKRFAQIFTKDNGEFACGDILKTCLNKVEGFNVLVCVSQQVNGMFVTDMVQPQKHRAVKEAAAKALEILKERLTNASSKPGGLSVLQRDSFFFDSKQVDLKTTGIPAPAARSAIAESGVGGDHWKMEF